MRVLQFLLENLNLLKEHLHIVHFLLRTVSILNSRRSLASFACTQEIVLHCPQLIHKLSQTMLKRNSSANGRTRSQSNSGYVMDRAEAKAVATIPTRQSQYNTREETNLTDSRAIRKITGMDVAGLVSLDLSRNSIKGETAFWVALRELHNLRTLKLQNNQLGVAQLNYLPEQLCSLDLSHNTLQELSLSRPHHSLKSLVCHHNRLLKASFPTSNPGLQSLDLSYNKLSLLNTIQLTNLSSLDASSNELVVINLNNQIKQVKLANCSLKSIAFISKLRELEEVVLTGNHLSDIRMNGFVVKDKMRVLDLSLNKIRYVEGLEVACPGLTGLDINRNEIYSLKNLYTELRQLFQLEDLDITQNDFYKTEPKEQVQKIQGMLRKELPNLKSFNGNSVTIRKTQQQRNSRSRPPLASVRVTEPNIAPPSSRFSMHIPHKPKPAYSSEVTPEKNGPASEASGSNYKESPYRLCDELLTSGRGYSGYKDKSTFKPKPTVQSMDHTINFTLGEREMNSRASLEEREYHLSGNKGMDLQETVYGSNQNVSFGAKKSIGKSFQHSLYKMNDFLDELVSFSIIPVRPILKTQKTRDFCSRIEQGREVQILKNLFKLCKKRPDMVKKNTNLSKIEQIRASLKDRDKLCLGFLKMKNFDVRKFKLLAGGRISLMDVLKQSHKAWVSVCPDKTTSHSILILFKKRLTSNQLPTDDVPVQMLDKMSLAYLIQSNQIQYDI